MKEKELVSLRKRPMKNGGQSIYLDYYLYGARHKEYLKLYLTEETTKLAKLKNAQTWKDAEAVKAKKILELQAGVTGVRKLKDDILLVEYLKSEQQRYTELGKDRYAATLKKIIVWITKYGKTITIRSVDGDYLTGFIRYLRSSHTAVRGKNSSSQGVEKLSCGTIRMFVSTLSTMFNNAIRARYIVSNPVKEIERFELPRAQETQREYLTMDEVQLLAKTPTRNSEMKRAFLFSCFTGLRLSDIYELTGKSIRETPSGKEIMLRQVKTRNIVYVPLSENALSCIRIYPNKATKLFRLPHETTLVKQVKRWVKSAGIEKTITFHCARHTYATLLLTYGADLYTVSKLLGHTNVTTTQIYARVIDQKRREAVEAVPKI